MTKSIRKEGWQQRLNGVITNNQNRDFVWGEWDCALWAAEAVKAMTGVDFAEKFRDKYDSMESAALALRGSGSGTLYNVLRSYFGNPVTPAKAWRGDIAYYRKSLGVCYGRVALFVGNEELVSGGEQTPDGLISIPLTEIDTVFRVR